MASQFKKAINMKDGVSFPVNAFFDLEQFRNFQMRQKRHTIMRTLLPSYTIPTGKHTVVTV